MSRWADSYQGQVVFVDSDFLQWPSLFVFVFQEYISSIVPDFSSRLLSSDERTRVVVFDVIFLLAPDQTSDYQLSSALIGYSSSGYLTIIHRH